MEKCQTVRWVISQKGRKYMQGLGQSKSTSLGACFLHEMSGCSFSPLSRKGACQCASWISQDGNTPIHWTTEWFDELMLKYHHKSADFKPAQHSWVITQTCLGWHSPGILSKHQIIKLLLEKWCQSAAGEVQELQAKTSYSYFGFLCGPLYTIDLINVCVFLIFWQLDGVYFSLL